MKVAIYTLGCKVNQYETQALEGELTRRGHSLVPFEELAHCYIINTCTVTAVSDKKSRQMIRRAKKGNSQAIVAVCGCYGQTDPEEVAGLGVDLVMGTSHRMEFLDKLEQLAQEKTNHTIIDVDNPFQRKEFEQLTPGGLEGRTRGMLKVEDGCINFCSYCIIPYARGPIRSLPLVDALAGAKALEEQGYREIVITGIEISSWGRDLEGSLTLVDLVEEICKAVPHLTIRLGSLEPRTITEEFCARLSGYENLCPHFHLSLQSGCDATLARMNRKYDSNRYLESVTLLRRYFKKPAITTDLIVGFPEETEEEFRQTLDFLDRCQLASVHVFPYSIRKGTPAATMKQVDGKVKEQRAKEAGALASQMATAWQESLIGEIYPVLFEQQVDGLWQGHTPNYVQVSVEGESLHNQTRLVRLTQITSRGMLGEVLSQI